MLPTDFSSQNWWLQTLTSVQVLLTDTGPQNKLNGFLNIFQMSWCFETFSKSYRIAICKVHTWIYWNFYSSMFCFKKLTEEFLVFLKIFAFLDLIFKDNQCTDFFPNILKLPIFVNVGAFLIISKCFQKSSRNSLAIF